MVGAHRSKEQAMHAGSSSTNAPFTLTKWYFDCVAADGRAVIAYWASLAWRKVALTWQNVTLYEAGRPPVSRSSLLPGPAPEVTDDTITCRMPALECMIDIESRQRPIEERLFESDDGVVEWRAEAPAAAVSLELRGFAPVQGPGYAERIFLSIPPWRLPIRELRWGRWLDTVAGRSVVWIDWRGVQPRTWVFVDGIKAPNAVVTDESISAGGVRVLLGERRALHERALADVVVTIPPLRAVVPKSLLALREAKWCSAGVLLDGNAPAQTGFAIHELAVFR
jgi:hypothetical protein